MPAAAPRVEKRIGQLPAIRCSDTLEAALMRLASATDRSLTDYVRLVLEKHAFGHASSVGGAPVRSNEA